jgi:hypothetical protein
LIVNVADVPELANELENVTALKAGQVPVQLPEGEQAEHLKHVRL